MSIWNVKGEGKKYAVVGCVYVNIKSSAFLRPLKIPFSPRVESRTDICWRVGIIYNTGWVAVPLRFSIDGWWLEVGCE